MLPKNPTRHIETPMIAYRMKRNSVHCAVCRGDSAMIVDTFSAMAAVHDTTSSLLLLYIDPDNPSIIRCPELEPLKQSHNISDIGSKIHIEVNEFRLTLDRALKLFTTFRLPIWKFWSCDVFVRWNCPGMNRELVHQLPCTASFCFLGSSRERKHHMTRTSR